MTATDRLPFRSSRFGGRESEPSCQVVKDRRLACRKALRFYVIAVVGWVQEKSDRTGLAGSKLGIPHPPPGPSPSHVGRKKPVYVPSEKRLSVAGSRFSVCFQVGTGPRAETQVSKTPRPWGTWPFLVHRGSGWEFKKRGGQLAVLGSRFVFGKKSWATSPAPAPCKRRKERGTRQSTLKRVQRLGGKPTATWHQRNVTV